jgi:hypothetical protein
VKPYAWTIQFRAFVHPPKVTAVLLLQCSASI